MADGLTIIHVAKEEQRMHSRCPFVVIPEK